MNTRAFDHVLIIMFENQYRSYVMQNEYMRNLAAQGIELTNSFGVMHPSQTNYISSISGELCGVTDDNQPRPALPQNTIVDLIEASPYNLAWRAYMQSYNANWTPWQATNFDPADAQGFKTWINKCFGSNDPNAVAKLDGTMPFYPYELKHNPFSSYANIIQSETRWKKIGNQADFYRDLLTDNFPQYAWFTPDMWSDGHYLTSTMDDDCKGMRAPALVDQQAAWLENFFKDLNFPGPNSKLPPKTLVIVTYDEADFESDFDTSQQFKYYYDGPNQIYTVLLGDMIQPGQQSECYNHYSVLKTIEKNFNLGSLNKNDKDANWFQFLWGRTFTWGKQQTTTIDDAIIKAAHYQNLIYLAYITKSGQLHYRTFDGHTLSPSNTLATDCGDSLSIAANDHYLLIAYTDQQQQLQTTTYHLTDGWKNHDLPTQTTASKLALSQLPNQCAFVMVYQSPQQQLFSLRFDHQQWQTTPDKLCSTTNKSFELAALGSNLLLIHQQTDNNQLACLSYNTEPFNLLNIQPSQYNGPQSNTTINTWSPCAFDIQHFAAKPSPKTPNEPEPSSTIYTIEGTLTTVTLEGVIHLMHNNPNNPQLMTETFSISGILTPENPVSYDPNAANTSNGYGTMMEVGWSEQRPINGALRKAHSPIAAAQLNGKIWLFYQPKGQQQLIAKVGGY